MDGNLDETSDFRADMINALSVAMSGRMSLKVSLRLLFDNEPAIELLDASAFKPGGVIPVELEELDSIFTVSLVVDF